MINSVLKVAKFVGVAGIGMVIIGLFGSLATNMWELLFQPAPKTAAGMFMQLTPGLPANIVLSGFLAIALGLTVSAVALAVFPYGAGSNPSRRKPTEKFKNTMLNVEDTAQAIDQAAGRLRQAATDLDRIARQMREKSDLGYAAEALTTVISAVQNSRLDLFVTRPIRALESDSNSVARK